MTPHVVIKNSQRILRRSLLSEHPNFLFWICFLGLNALLFLPTYVFNRGESTFLPLVPRLVQDPADVATQLLAWRNNLDLFRLNAEFVLMITLWTHLPSNWKQPLRSYFFVLFVLIYGLTFVYAVYESLTLYFYQVDAVLYAHLQLLIDGLGFFVSHMQISSISILAGSLVIISGIVFLLFIIREIFVKTLDKLSKASRILLKIGAVFIIYSLIFNRNILASPKSVVSSLVVKVYKNTIDSIALSEEIQALDNLELQHSYDYSGQTLLATPNIYLIFVESYGSILYKREVFRDKYLGILSEKQTELERNGWFATSTLSESPTWGGGSWLAYTSVLFGLKIDTHPQYLSLLNQFQDQEYPDLGFTLRTLGYRYIRATSLAVELNDQDWQKYVDFYGVDSWIRYSDFDFHGTHYGWGPSPPDQYILNAAHEKIVEKSDKPFLLFLITQNSHFPWRAVPTVVDDWHSLNDGNSIVTVFDEEGVAKKVRQEDYIKAITYELDFLTDFILKEAGENDIFILIGDHQPGYVTRREDGFDTPLHIISKNSEFIEKFAPYGFDSGLRINDMTPTIKHEGFYSLFMKLFLEHFGSGNKAIPPYLPSGVVVKTN